MYGKGIRYRWSDVVSPPTRTATDWALVALTEMGASTPTLETMVPVDGGADGFDGQSLGLESLGMCNGGSDGVMGDIVQGHEESEPIRVEPLAIVISQGVEGMGHEHAKDIGRKPSDWVLRKEKGVGKVLRASYEGYEQVVTEILMEIEARHLQRKAVTASLQRPPSSGKKGSRELKGLASSTNYEARHSKEAKGKGKVQEGGAVVVYQ